VALINQFINPWTATRLPFIIDANQYFATSSLVGSTHLNIAALVAFAALSNPVLVGHGQSAVTVTQVPANSSAIASENESTYDLVAK
jgi:hypothetical protein